MCIFCDNFGMHVYIDAYNHPDSCQVFKEYLLEQQRTRSQDDAKTLSFHAYANYVAESSPHCVEHRPKPEHHVNLFPAQSMHESEILGRYYQGEGPHYNEPITRSKPLAMYSPCDYDISRSSSVLDEVQRPLWVTQYEPKYEYTQDFQAIERFSVRDQQHESRDVNKQTWLHLISHNQEGTQVPKMQKRAFTPQTNGPLKVQRERKLIHQREKRDQMTTVAGPKHSKFQLYQQRVPELGDMRSFKICQAGSTRRSAENVFEKRTHLDKSAHVLTQPSDRKVKGKVGMMEGKSRPFSTKSKIRSLHWRKLENDTGCIKKAKKESRADRTTMAIPFRSFDQHRAPPAANKAPDGEVRKAPPAPAPASLSTSPSIPIPTLVQVPTSSLSYTSGATFGKHKNYPTPNHKLLR